MTDERASVPPAGDSVAPAFYAVGTGGWRDWWLLLHPPYTAWHLSYIVVGACLAPYVNTTRLLATLLAFFFAVGIAAHALDELNGRPLRTQLRSGYLVAATVIGLAAAVALGAVGVTKTGWVLVPFIVVGPLIVVAYNAELFGGVVHNDAGFAAGWGAFPVLGPGACVGGPRGFRAVGRSAAPQHACPGLAPPDRACRRHCHDFQRRGPRDRSAIPARPSRGRPSGLGVGDGAVRNGARGRATDLSRATVSQPAGPLIRSCGGASHLA